MDNRERIGNKQTAAEFRNVEKRIKRLRRTGEAVPTELFDRRTELEQRLHTTRSHGRV